MRLSIGGVSLYFDVDGCGLVPEGPAMVERPTVIALHGGPGADHGTFKRTAAIRHYWDGEAADEVREAYARVCIPLYSQRPGGDPDGPDRMRRIRWNPEVLQHFRRSLAGTFDPWPRLDRVTCPVLVLAGEHDPVATVPAARRLTAALTATAPWLRVVPDAGRRLFREYPERARALLGDFLAAHRR